MLRYFEDIDLATLLIYLDLFHVLLVHRLDRHFLSRLLMRCQLDQSKLAFAEVVLE
jgi:hypothetical protein